MWGSLSPGSLCIIPVRYKVGPESHQEAISRLLNITQFGGENSMFNLLPLISESSSQEESFKNS